MSALLDRKKALVAPEPFEVFVPLEHGERVSGDEFMRRYEQMPGVKAELIGGVVYIMSSPVRSGFHGVPNLDLAGWFYNYQVDTPGIEASVNGTVKLGEGDIPQPDGILRIVASWGRSRISKDDYIEGPPELVAEISASTLSIDRNRKSERYRKFGVREYIIWRTEERAIDWWQLVDGRYEPLPRDEKGIVRSVVFPGLWLNVPALVARDFKALRATLEAGLASAEHSAFVERLKNPPAAN